MKPGLKISSFFLAMAIAITAFAGCTPISLNKEWAYKTSDNELAIGVYIYSLDTAYQRAKTYAENLDDYDDQSDSWLDMEITDDDGNKEVASKWIKDQAQLMCLSYLVVDEQLKKEGVEVDKNTLASADETAEEYWNVGMYADYGYVMPMSDDLKPYGISQESFAYCSTEYTTKYQALFDALYKEGGSKEVTNSQLSDYFTENYVDYSYFTVNLYTSETDDSGQQTNKAMSDEDAKKVKDQIDGYADDINNGKSYEDVVNDYMKADDISTDPTQSATENLDDSTLGDEVKEALEKLDSNKAITVQVGDGDSAVYYLVYKKDINNTAKTYFDTDTNRDSVLTAMKQDEFDKYIEDLTKELDYEANTSQLDRYKPGMFFVKPEETTAAASSDTESSGTE